MKSKLLLFCLLFSGISLQSGPVALPWTPGFAFTVEKTKCTVNGGEITIGGGPLNNPLITISLKGRTVDYSLNCTDYAHDEGGTCSGCGCGNSNPYTIYSLPKAPPPVQ